MGNCQSQVDDAPVAVSAPTSIQIGRSDRAQSSLELICHQPSCNRAASWLCTCRRVGYCSAACENSDKPLHWLHACHGATSTASTSVATPPSTEASSQATRSSMRLPAYNKTVGLNEQDPANSDVATLKGSYSSRDGLAPSVRTQGSTQTTVLAQHVAPMSVATRTEGGGWDPKLVDWDSVGQPEPSTFHLPQSIIANEFGEVIDPTSSARLAFSVRPICFLKIIIYLTNAQLSSFAH
jgi:hypothetical protein